MCVASYICCQTKYSFEQKKRLSLSVSKASVQLIYFEGIVMLKDLEKYRFCTNTHNGNYMHMSYIERSTDFLITCSNSGKGTVHAH